MENNPQKTRTKEANYWKEVFRRLDKGNYQSAFQLVGIKIIQLIKWYELGMVDKKDLIEYIKYLDINICQGNNQKNNDDKKWYLVQTIIHAFELADDKNFNNQISVRYIEKLSGQLVR